MYEKYFRQKVSRKPNTHIVCSVNISWYQTFALFCMLYVFFWVIPRRLNFICRRFGTLCLFHLHRQAGIEWLNLRMLGYPYGRRFGSKIAWADRKESIFEPDLLPYGYPNILKFSHSIPTCLWRWNRQSVPKRRHIKFRRRGITQKKAYRSKRLFEDNRVVSEIKWRSHIWQNCTAHALCMLDD